jgi:hypothetical protein
MMISSSDYDSEEILVKDVIVQQRQQQQQQLPMPLRRKISTSRTLTKQVCD